MKQSLKVAATLIAFAAAALILSYILKWFGALMIIISDNCEIPL